MVDDVLEHLEHLHLLLGRQGRKRRQDLRRRRVDFAHERRVVHEREQSHQELAIHAVEETAVAGERVAKVFDAGGALEARREEAAEGSDERRERGEDDRVQLEWRIWDRRDVLAGLPCAIRNRMWRGSARLETSQEKKNTYDLLEKRGNRSRDRELVPHKDVVRLAFDVAKDTGRQVLNGADHVVESHKERSPLPESTSSSASNFCVAKAFVRERV